MWCTLIKRKPDFSGKMFWSLEIPFKTGFTVLIFETRWYLWNKYLPLLPTVTS